MSVEMVSSLNVPSNRSLTMFDVSEIAEKRGRKMHRKGRK